MAESGWLIKSKSHSQPEATQTPVRKDVQVPVGHILISDKWKGTPLSQELRRHTSVLFDHSLGVVDFHLPNHLIAIYISEIDLISGNSYRQKVGKFKNGKGKGTHGLVFVEVTLMSGQHFQQAQKFIVLDLKMDVFPVSSQKDAAEALTHLIQNRNHQNVNQFLNKPRLPPVDVTIANALQAIPNIGQVKVQALMNKYPDLLSLSQASITDLTHILKTSSAQQIYDFFHQKLV